VGVDLAKLLVQDLPKRLQPLRLGFNQQPLAVRLLPGTSDLLLRRRPRRPGIALPVGQERLDRLGLDPGLLGLRLAQRLAGRLLELTRLSSAVLAAQQPQPGPRR
jgi:hypothetical protein